MDRKEEYAVCVKKEKEWYQYSAFGPLKYAQENYISAKKKGYSELKLIQRVITVSEFRL